jgi:O-antigen biosynthesis protein
MLYTHKKIIIGVPVYNEKQFIRATLDSLAAQTYKDFLVLIADNASDDGSSDICREFAANDKRFLYYRQQTNIGASKNFQFIYENTDSPYLMWLGAHDLIAPEYLEQQLKILDNDPGIALAYSRVTWIDELGNITRETNGGEFVHNDESGLVRYLKTVKGPWGECTAFNGIIRRTALPGIKFFAFAGPDQYILTKIQFYGKFYRNQKSIYLRREFKIRNTNYFERITGKKTALINTKKNDFNPLAFQQIKDYWILEINLVKKIIKFPSLIIALEKGYGLWIGQIRNIILGFLFNMSPMWLIKYYRDIKNKNI